MCKTRKEYTLQGSEEVLMRRYKVILDRLAHLYAWRAMTIMRHSDFKTNQRPRNKALEKQCYKRAKSDMNRIHEDNWEIHLEAESNYKVKEN